MLRNRFELASFVGSKHYMASKMSNSLDHNSTDFQNGSKGVEVFVGGLARTLTEDKVHKVFSACGEILEMRLIKDQRGGLKGFGFIRFATKEAADKALKELAGSVLEGKKIGVLPSAAQDTLFLGNLNKGWSADDFNKVIRQVFPDVVSIDLSQPLSGSDTAPNKKFKNRGFGFVKFTSHAAAARAFRAGSKPDFVLGSTLHPTVKWAEEDNEVGPDELAKIKIAFVRNLPSSTDESYLNKLFVPFGKVDKVVVHSKGIFSVGFVHFAQRSHLDSAIEGLNEKMVQGPYGSPPFKLHVEVARPMDKKRKRVHEDLQNTQPREVLSNFRPQYHEPVLNTLNGHRDTLQKEPLGADPYEAAVLLLPVAVRERLLRILRLGIATRYDIAVESLTNLAELPESNAILVLDQYQVDKLRSDQLPLGLSRSREANVREPVGLLSGRMNFSAVDSHALHVDPSVPRSDGYASRYSSLYQGYSLPSHIGALRTEERSPLHLQELPGSSASVPYSRYLVNSHIPAAYANLEEMSPIPSHQIQIPDSYQKPAQDPYQIPTSSAPYANVGADSHLAASGDRQATRPQMRFDPFTGQPYKFDPFTGEPIIPESATHHYESPY
ncbi:Nucleotide-binding, alpha-beta plait [Artemisia annua]|uniref:Nucleotide-binding, alpha-beta plait n=1 Tax=Artemisia annua TaxID=35608 RepID=A0A2U1PQS0_ARTAN|nr:Nucleotide-binding, alpha-beta plait [Artemisia annua]